MELTRQRSWGDRDKRGQKSSQTEKIACAKAERMASWLECRKQRENGRGRVHGGQWKPTGQSFVGMFSILVFIPRTTEGKPLKDIK